MTFLSQRIVKWFPSLSVPIFRSYAGTQFISLIGSWAYNVALGWLSYEISKSVFFLGLVTAAEHFPAFFFSLPMGKWCDENIHRIELAIGLAKILLLAQSLLLISIVSTNMISPTLILFLAVSSSLLNAFDFQARQLHVYKICGKPMLPSAIALNSAMYNAARILGPAFAGLALSAWGAVSCFSLNSLCYIPGCLYFLILSQTGQFRSKTRHHHVSEATTNQESLAQETWHYLRKHIHQGEVLIRVYASSLFGFAYVVLMPALAKTKPLNSTASLGVLYCINGIGALWAATKTSQKPPRSVREIRRIQFNFGASSIFFALSFLLVQQLNLNLWTCDLLLSPSLIVAGYWMVQMMAGSNVYLQTNASHFFRGRIASLHLMSAMGFFPMGSLIFTKLAEMTSLTSSIFLSGFSVILAHSFLRLFFPHHIVEIQQPLVTAESHDKIAA